MSGYVLSSMPGILPGVAHASAAEEMDGMEPEGFDFSLTICPVCPHACLLGHQRLGACGARFAKDGVSTSANYGQVTAMALDPIEKKPLAYFHPGSWVLSVGSFGCNMSCPFCQNYGISKAEPEDVKTTSWTPEALADKALELAQGGSLGAGVGKGNLGLAYTYNEPLVGYEFVRDTALCIKERGLKNVLVTNGCVTQYTAGQVFPLIDAFNIDLKVFDPQAYASLGGSLEAVKQSITWAVELGKHVELTTLIVPGLNDDDKMMEQQARWIASLNQGKGEDIPLHITRFFPRYQMQDASPTDNGVMERLAQVASRHLNHVCLGNV